MTDIDNVNTAGRVGRRLVAIPVAVVAGIVVVFALDSILHHGKGWQMPTIFLATQSSRLHDCGQPDGD